MLTGTVPFLGETVLSTAVKRLQEGHMLIMFPEGGRAQSRGPAVADALDFATLLGGTIFTEYIFDIEGMGRWALGAIQGVPDIPVVTATVLVAASFIVVSNLIVDVVYSFLDPRVRLA